MDARRILGAVAALVTTLPGGCQGDETAPAQRTVAPCSWSYFGDPRAVAHEQPRDHRLRRHGWPHGARGLRPRHRPAAAADRVRPARGRRPQQSEPRLLPRAAVRVLGAAQRLPVPARPPQPGPLPDLDAAVGRGRRLRRHADGPARARLRARLHVPEPGRRRRPAVPVHARAVLGAVLHLDDRRRPLDRAAHASSRRRRRASRTAAAAAGCARTRSTRQARATPC